MVEHLQVMGLVQNFFHPLLDLYHFNSFYLPEILSIVFWYGTTTVATLDFAPLIISILHPCFFFICWGQKLGDSSSFFLGSDCPFFRRSTWSTDHGVTASPRFSKDATASKQYFRVEGGHWWRSARDQYQQQAGCGRWTETWWRGDVVVQHEETTLNCSFFQWLMFHPVKKHETNWTLNISPTKTNRSHWSYKRTNESRFTER